MWGVLGRWHVWGLARRVGPGLATSETTRQWRGCRFIVPQRDFLFFYWHRRASDIRIVGFGHGTTLGASYCKPCAARLPFLRAWARASREQS